ncbi:MAG: phenylalanine--tRNA ligase subunit beta [Rubrobacter sp.]|nr:phenylalanine--tRNA ligase subunit beta [Rubrobacter sp.]
MRVPLSWLREYVDFDLSVDELVKAISLHSQEVDGIHRLGVLDGEVVVGEVVEFGPHPNADRLSVAKVDLGGQEVQIVAGAPNPYPGARVPVVLPGSVMADGTKLRKAKLRGLESNGMMMSERELGISNDHSGILLLDESYEVGRQVAEYFPVGETVLELDVNPNRPDLWGMIGVARELAAILGTDFRIPDISFETGGPPTADYGLRVEAEDLCPRYDLRRVSNISPGGRAPLEMRRRIFAAGMRPINAIVDISNFTMLETGQPNHVFDASRVREGIVVRRAKPAEKMKLLDGTTRDLDTDMLVIADEERGLVIAGVMGAEDAEVGNETTDVLIEVATFAGQSIFGTSARLALRTDASGRNERGLDPNMVPFARDRVASLLAEHAGGTIASDTLSHYPEPVDSWEAPLRLGRAELLLGIPVERDEAVGKLEALGCGVQAEDGRISASIPTFRRDLRREADLIEEVGRLFGLGRVPEELPKTSLSGGLTPAQQKVRTLRRLLADLGLAEAITYPFGPDRWRRDLSLESGHEPPTLANPLSAQAREMRSMLLPGLLDAAARNEAFGVESGAIFEVGRVFEARPLPEGKRDAALHFRLTGELNQPGTDAEDGASSFMGVEENQRVGGVLTGAIQPGGWNAPVRRAGFFEAKGIVERLVPGASFSPEVRPFLHPGRSAVVRAGDAAAGWVGELHPETAEKFDLSGGPVAAFELDLAFCDPDPAPRFQPFTNVPAVSRDLAVVVDSGVPAGDMLAAVGKTGSTMLAGARVFDVYEGAQVPEGKKSVALRFAFRGEETLTDEAVNGELDRISLCLRESFGAEVRGD